MVTPSHCMLTGIQLDLLHCVGFLSDGHLLISNEWLFSLPWYIPSMYLFQFQGYDSPLSLNRLRCITGVKHVQLSQSKWIAIPLGDTSSFDMLYSSLSKHVQDFCWMSSPTSCEYPDATHTACPSLCSTSICPSSAHVCWGDAWETTPSAVPTRQLPSVPHASPDSHMQTNFKDWQTHVSFEPDNHFGWWTKMGGGESYGSYWRMRL